MQTLLKLTVTGNGDMIEEVEGEVRGRERAQSDAFVWADRPKLVPQGETVKARILQREESKKLLEDVSKNDSKPATPRNETTEPDLQEPAGTGLYFTIFFFFLSFILF